MNAQEVINAIERWYGEFSPTRTPEDVFHAILADINMWEETGYTHDEIERDTKLILAWLRDPTIIDEDHDDSEQWIRKHHG